MSNNKLTYQEALEIILENLFPFTPEFEPLDRGNEENIKFKIFSADMTKSVKGLLKIKRSEYSDEKTLIRQGLFLLKITIKFNYKRLLL